MKMSSVKDMAYSKPQDEMRAWLSNPALVISELLITRLRILRRFAQWQEILFWRNVCRSRHRLQSVIDPEYGGGHRLKPVPRLAFRANQVDDRFFARNTSGRNARIPACGSPASMRVMRLRREQGC